MNHRAELCLVQVYEKPKESSFAPTEKIEIKQLQGFKHIKIVSRDQLILAYFGDFLCYISMKQEKDVTIKVKNLRTSVSSKIDLLK